MSEESQDALLEGLAGWLAPRLGEVRLEPLGKPGSGFSAENLIFDAITPSGERRRWLLRRDTDDESPYPEQAPGLGTRVALQQRVLTALAGQVPVATVLGFEPGAGLIGAPFFVMEFIDGVVPGESPPCTVEGFYADARPELRAAMAANGLAALARLHEVSWRTAPLAVLADGRDRPDAGRQLDLWRDHLVRGLRDRSEEVFDRTLDLLAATVPDLADEPVLVWGDARPGNIIWDPETGAVRAVMDFEGAAVGDRWLDVGWWLMADRWMHEGSGVDRLPGEPSRAEQVRIYAEASGAAARDTRWYELFAALRFAVTVVHVMNKWETAGLVPADHTIWRENPAIDLVRAISAETEEAGPMTTYPVRIGPYTATDDEFHLPEPADDPDWTETCWFTFTVPERRLSGQLYPFFKPTLGVTSAGAYFWDETGDQVWSCRYAKNFWHLPLPDQPLSDLTLGNGARYRVLEPGLRYAIGYDDPDGDELHVDLEFTGIAAPHYLDESHLDQPGRFVGEIVLGGERIPVDSYGFRDRSWGHRTQHGAGIHGTTSQRGGYSYATASPERAFHAITMDFGDGTAHVIHGYLIEDGRWGKLGPGRRDVLERDEETGAPTRVRLTATDEHGRSLDAVGTTLNRIGLLLNPNLWTWNCLTEWTWSGGTAYGEDHDNWSAAGQTAFARGRRT